MENRIVLRRHLITLTPDAILLIVSFIFVLEAILSIAEGKAFLRILSEASATFLLLVAALDMIKWFGFRVVIENGCIEVQKFWIFQDHFCHIGRDVKVQPVQKSWDQRLNMGTLIVYQPGGKVSTLDNLGHFDRVVDNRFLPQR